MIATTIGLETIALVLLIIALLIYILGRRPF